MWLSQRHYYYYYYMNRISRDRIGVSPHFCIVHFFIQFEIRLTESNRFRLKCDLIFFFSRMNWIFYAKMPLYTSEWERIKKRFIFVLFTSSLIHQSLASIMANQTANFPRHLRDHSGSKIRKWVIVVSIYISHRFNSQRFNFNSSSVQSVNEWNELYKI